jgi:ariadne-1
MVPAPTSGAARSRADLERYLHYYSRYENHDRSAKLDREVYATIEKSMEALQAKTDLSWIQVQFLRDAADALFRCRMTLKWTYAFAFYLVRNNQTELFEDNQRDLEMAVEQLSEMLERPVDVARLMQGGGSSSNPDGAALAASQGSRPDVVFRREVIDKTDYVDRRRQVLLSDTARGLAEDRWQFVPEEPKGGATAGAAPRSG